MAQRLFARRAGLNFMDEPPPSPGHSVAIVEDDDEVRRSLVMMLRARGYRVDAYRSASEVRLLPFPLVTDCLLTDYKMPGIDGLKLLELLVDDGWRKPAILITGFLSPHLRAKAVLTGFGSIIEKPACARLVCSEIDRLCQGPPEPA